MRGRSRAMRSRTPGGAPFPPSSAPLLRSSHAAASPGKTPSATGTAAAASRVTATTQWFALDTGACALFASRRHGRRFAVDFPDPPDTPCGLLRRARRTAVVTRIPDAKPIPRFLSVRVACTPRGCSRACSFLRTEIDLLRGPWTSWWLSRTLLA